MLIVTYESLIILLLILLNGFFSMSEIAVVTARKSKLRLLADKGSKAAKNAVALADEPSSFLSSVQIGITLVGILAGAFGGATIAGNISRQIAAVDWIMPYADTIGLGIVVIAILFLTVVLGELVPKQLALSNPEKFALLVAHPISLLSRAAAPVVSLFSGTSRIVLAIFGVKAEITNAMTDEEITFIVHEGVLGGIFEKSESDMVGRVLRLDDRVVGAFMTPRVDMRWLDEAAGPAAIRNLLTNHPHDAYPICRGSADNIVGIAYSHDIYARLLNGEKDFLANVMKPPLILNANMQALKAIHLLQKSREHMAIIVNEYGETDGIITTSDVLVSLIGTVSTPAEERIVMRAEGSWLVDGAAGIDEVRDAIAGDIFPEEHTADYNTVAGFIMNETSRIPNIGDRLEWGDYLFEVVDKDGNRIDRVLIERNKL